MEDLDIFENADGDAVLLAISIIMQAGRSEGEFSLSLADLAKDIEEDGVWNDSLERAQSADNAFEVELTQVRENILGWNISQKISMFENYVEYFWSDVFGLGRCTEKREGEIRPDTNPKSRYFNEKFICEKQHWHLLGKKLSSSSTEESSSSSISAESSSSSANDSSESGDSSSSGKSSSSIKRSSSSRQSTATIDPPYKEETSIIDPEVLAILGTCNDEGEGSVKKAFNSSFVCKSGLWYSLLLADMEQDSWFNPNITYGSLTDQRDGQTYRTVVIGTQKWMAENLHYAGENADATTLANLAEENLCPWNDEKYCSKSGYHYSWTAAMNISPIYKNRVAASYPITDKHQGLCPNGWHIPTYDEWNELFDFVISVYGEVAPSRALKAVDGWTWFSKEQTPTNSTGLSILGTGQYYSWGHSEGEEIGQSTYFITATTPESKYYTMELFGFTQNLHDISNWDFSQPAFVRCVENAAP